MRRLATLTVLAVAVAAAAHLYRNRGEDVPAEGNGHSGDADRTAMVRDRIAAARRRLRDELDSVRGE
jgi:hypothetical protein